MEDHTDCNNALGRGHPPAAISEMKLQLSEEWQDEMDICASEYLLETPLAPDSPIVGMMTPPGRSAPSLYPVRGSALRPEEFNAPVALPPDGYRVPHDGLVSSMCPEALYRAPEPWDRDESALFGPISTCPPDDAYCSDFLAPSVDISAWSQTSMQDMRCTSLDIGGHPSQALTRLSPCLGGHQDRPAFSGTEGVDMYESHKMETVPPLHLGHPELPAPALTRPGMLFGATSLDSNPCQPIFDAPLTISRSSASFSSTSTDHSTVFDDTTTSFFSRTYECRMGQHRAMSPLGTSHGLCQSLIGDAEEHEVASCDLFTSRLATLLSDEEGMQKDRNTANCKEAARNTSEYKGVSLHKKSGRWEAHIWVKALSKQLYLGGFDTPEKAAVAYDVIALKTKGLKVELNFKRERYEPLVELLSQVEIYEAVNHVKRISKGFSRGQSKFRGITQHQNGRWEARLGIPGNRHLYLGLHNDPAEAARSYDCASVRMKGRAATTNYPTTKYPEELEEYDMCQQMVSERDLMSFASLRTDSVYWTWVKQGGKDLLYQMCGGSNAPTS